MKLIAWEVCAKKKINAELLNRKSGRSSNSKSIDKSNHPGTECGTVQGMSVRVHASRVELSLASFPDYTDPPTQILGGPPGKTPPPHHHPVASTALDGQESPGLLADKKVESHWQNGKNN